MAIADLEDALPPPAIDWHEGMLLAPQHFQLLSRRIDELAAYRIADAAPFAWGVRRVQADPALLIEGVVRLEALEAVLADGTIVSLAEDDPELRLELGAFKELERGAPLRVWLALPTRHAGADGRDDDSRFRSVEGPLVWDETTGEGRMRMPVLRPRLRLMAGERPPRKHTSLALFEVKRERDLITLTDYEPPRLALGDAPLLLAACRAIALRMREQAAMLLEALRAEASADVPLGGGNRTVVATLLGPLPELETTLACPSTPPLAVHRLLLGVAGRLAVLQSATLPPVFPAYAHDDLCRCFAPLLAFIIRRLGSVRVLCREVAFERQDGEFRLASPPENLAKGITVGLRRASGVSADALAEWFERALVCSAPLVQAHLERRTLGAPRKRLERDDRLGIAASEQMILFRLEGEGAAMLAGEPLIVRNRLQDDRPCEPAGIVLFASSADTADG